MPSQHFETRQLIIYVNEIAWYISQIEVIDALRNCLQVLIPLAFSCFEH